MREQAAVRDRWLTQRLLDVLPDLMDRAGIDLWLVVGRENNEDPVLTTLLPATWLSARRRTILALHRSDDGVTAAAVSRYPVGQFLPAWSPEAPARRRRPRSGPRSAASSTRPPRERIGIDVSESFALADGLSHTEHRLLSEALGPWADRLVPVLISNLMAVLLQGLASKLGIVTGRDLAQACRDHYSQPVDVVLWVLCEIAIAACDLAEVIGSAIALNLLFGIPLSGRRVHHRRSTCCSCSICRTRASACSRRSSSRSSRPSASASCSRSSSRGRTSAT